MPLFFFKKVEAFIPVHNLRKSNKFYFVFDAASKSHGQCLDSCLLPGPNFFNSLISILFQFRKHKFAYAGDIEEIPEASWSSNNKKGVVIKSDDMERVLGLHWNFNDDVLYKLNPSIKDLYLV